MPDPGDVIIVDFPGAQSVKRRPAVVLSTSLYHTHRPDVVVGLLTGNTGAATAPTDYVLNDWARAGLHKPSAFRSYLATIEQAGVVYRGRLSDRDWQGVLGSLARALTVLPPPGP